MLSFLIDTCHHLFDRMIVMKTPKQITSQIMYKRYTYLKIDIVTFAAYTDSMLSFLMYMSSFIC